MRVKNQEAANTQSRISACTIQIENLKKRIEELQKTIEGRNTVMTQTKKLLDNSLQQSQLEFQRRDMLKQYHLVPICNSLLLHDATVDKPKAYQWKSFGLCLGLDIEDLAPLTQNMEYSMASTYDFVIKILEKWFQKPNCPTYYRQLKLALKAAGLNEEADKLIPYDELPQLD